MFKVKGFVNLILFVLIVSILMSPAICKAEETVTFRWPDYEPVYYPATIEIPYIPYPNPNPVVFEIYQLQDSNPIPAYPISFWSDSNPIPPSPISPFFMYAFEGLLYQDINPVAQLFVPAFSIGFGGGYAGQFTPDQDPDDFPPWIQPYASFYGAGTSLGSYYGTGLDYGYGINLGSDYYLGQLFGW